MIQKTTVVYPIDKSGALKCNVFHTYRGGGKRISGVGEFVKVSLRKVKPDIKLKKKSKSRALVARSVFRTLKLDGSFFNYYENSVVLIKRKMVMRSRDFTDPADRKIRRKKLIYKFPGIL